MPKMFLTPLGDRWLTQNEVDQEGRIVCSRCEVAVIEDEYIPCPNCDATICLYCWEDHHWQCPVCNETRGIIQAE